MVAEEKETENPQNEEPEQKKSRSFMKWVKLGIVVAGLLGEVYGAYAIVVDSYPAIYKYLHKPSKLLHNTVVLSDLIVNPATTNIYDQHFLVVSIGVDLKYKEEMPILKNRESVIKEAIITMLAKYNLKRLRNPSLRKGLKQEIGIVINTVMQKNVVKSLYFTKFVLQ